MSSKAHAALVDLSTYCMLSLSTLKHAAIDSDRDDVDALPGPLVVMQSRAEAENRAMKLAHFAVRLTVLTRELATSRAVEGGAAAVEACLPDVASLSAHLKCFTAVCFDATPRRRLGRHARRSLLLRAAHLVSAIGNLITRVEEALFLAPNTATDAYASDLLLIDAAKVLDPTYETGEERKRWFSDYAWDPLLATRDKVAEVIGLVEDASREMIEHGPSKADAADPVDKTASLLSKTAFVEKPVKLEYDSEDFDDLTDSDAEGDQVVWTLRRRTFHAAFIKFLQTARLLFKKLLLRVLIHPGGIPPAATKDSTASSTLSLDPASAFIALDYPIDDIEICERVHLDADMFRSRVDDIVSDLLWSANAMDDDEDRAQDLYHMAMDAGQIITDVIDTVTGPKGLRWWVRRQGLDLTTEAKAAEARASMETAHRWFVECAEQCARWLADMETAIALDMDE